MRWAEIIEHLRAEYLVGREEEGWIELTWRFREDALAIAQHQTVRSTEAWGEPHVLIAAELASGGTLSPGEALRHNASLAIGAIAQEDERMVLRTILPADGLTPARLGRALYAVAHEAARLSAQLRPAWTPRLYEAYCD